MRIAIVLLALVASLDARAGAKKGERAPEFTLPSLSGEKLALASLRGKVVVIDFWAEWCGPCKKELPELERLQRAYATKNVVVVAINLDKQRGNAERLVRELGLTLRVLLDPAGAVAGSYDLPKMPTSFVVDKKGIVRFVHEGFEGGADVERFRRELDELVK